MGGDRDAAADVADDEVAVLVAASHALRMADCRLFQVQGMEMDVAIYTLDAGHAGIIAELVGVRWIHDEGRLVAREAGEFMGELASELGWMLHAVGSCRCIVEHLRVDGVDATLAGHEATATTNKGIDIRKLQVVVIEDIENHVAAIRQLG